MAIKSVKRVNVSEQVFEQMKQQLIDQEWKSGERLPSEATLSDLFGVSRVTIRNALQKLVALGLIETRLGDGSYVRESSADSYMNSLIPMVYLEHNLREIMEFRLVIETETTVLAAQRATKQDIKTLRKYIKQMENTQDDYREYAKLDYEFHYAIAQISKNSLIIRTYTILMDALQNAMTDIVGRMSGEWGMVSHPKIVDAIEAGDTKKAHDYMRNHLLKNYEYIDMEDTNGKKRCTNNYRKNDCSESTGYSSKSST